MSDASDRTSPFEKVTFFARRAGDGAAAQRQRKFSHFGSHSSCSQGKSTRFSPTEPPARAAQSTLQTVLTELTSTLHACTCQTCATTDPALTVIVAIAAQKPAIRAPSNHHRQQSRARATKRQQCATTQSPGRSALGRTFSLKGGRNPRQSAG